MSLVITAGSLQQPGRLGGDTSQPSCVSLFAALGPIGAATSPRKVEAEINMTAPGVYDVRMDSVASDSGR